MEISEIKQNLTLSTVLQHYGLKPDKSHRLNCPFHEDKTPSLQVYYKTHTAYCFSSNCKTHGKSIDTIDFIMYMENSSKAEAINKAKALINPTCPADSGNTKPASTAESRESILTRMFTYFKNAVHNSKPAQEYIKSRNLDATRIEIGYNTAQFHHGSRRDEQLIQKCVQLGLLTPWGTNNKTGGQAYKPFAKECICFALRNKLNQITGLYFRSTSNNSDQRHFYLKNRQGLYPCYPKADTKKLILTESIIDAATLIQQEAIIKQYSILALYGTNGLTEEHTEAIKALHQLEEVIFFLNGDEPGRKATQKYTSLLKTINPTITISTVNVPENEDVNSLSQTHEPEVLAHLLESRTAINTNAVQSDENGTSRTERENLEPTTYNSQLKTKNPHKLEYSTDTAEYAVLGGVSKAMDSMKVTLQIQSKETGQKIRNKADLYEDKQVEKLCKEVSEKLNLPINQLETDIYRLTDLLDDYRTKELEEQQAEEAQEQTRILTATERNEAMQIGGAKNLMHLLKEKLTQTGIVGEDENKVFLFVIGASHIQQHPLNALIQGSSGSGKTRLLKQIFYCMPEESRKIYSRCSEKMLYNVPRFYFKNKVICFEDVDGLGEDAEYAWRELVSNGELISGVSYKDDKGNMTIKELTVCGPITSIACTTKGSIYADNMSRMFLIAIDESAEQTRRINDYQAKEAAGQINKEVQKKAINELQNYVRILKPYEVYNPHAMSLKLPEGIRDERRLYRLYLYFIDMITVLHQYQRKQQNGKLIATKQDCQIAKDLMFECIMLKMDELDGSLRQFFERLKEYIKKQENEQHQFTQREVRHALNVSKTQLQRFINDLIELEYLQHTIIPGNKGNKYQIKYWDNYRKLRGEVKEYLQDQIDQLKEE